MSDARSAPRRRLGWLAGATTFLLLASMLAAGPAPALTPCTSPPATISQAKLTPGTLGTGLTTLDGTTPVPFDFEVVGTIPDGWMLGLDAIVIHVTGPSSFLDATGGVFFGMSGSPTYVNGKLAGAVSGVFWDDPTFGVLTPAKAMLEVLESAQGSPLSLARTIRPTEEVRRAMARELRVAPSEVTGTFQQLPTPLGVAGLPPAKVRELQARLDERGENFFVYSGSAARASASAVTPIPFAPGEPLGAAISYGDASLYATGTATFTCGDYVVAFGHPFFWDAPGEVSLGLAGAEGLMLVKGGQGLWPGYRFALLTEPRGTVTQDRFAGIAGVVGQEPSAVPVRSHLMSRDSGARRAGLTEAIHTWGWWLEYIVWGHLWLNYSAVLGHYPAEGTADLAWTISGTTAEGPFTISNHWMTYSEWDATDVIWRLLSAIDVLQFNDLEDVTFTGISTHGTITKDELVGEMTRLRVASTSQPDLRSRATLLARPGDVVTVQALLDLAEGGTQAITASFRVPRGTSGDHRIVVRGGKERGLWEDFSSFDDLVRTLNGGEHPDDLVIAGLGRTRLRPQDLLIEGRDAFRLRIVR